MKRSRWKTIALISVLSLVVGLVLILFFKSKPVIPPIPAAQSSQATPTVASKPAQDASIYKTDPKWIWWNEQMERDPSFEWKMPIEFYGKVIDQDNKPVQGVKVVFQWTDTSPTGTSERTVYSNNDGSFELTGVQGKRLGLTQIYKDGYFLVTTDLRHSFEYAAFFEENYHQPDTKNPVILCLRKKGDIPQELITRRTLMGIKPTGEPHFIDLRTTRKTSAGEGDIAISITRTAPPNVKKYDWSASIKGVNGTGLLESTDEFMFEAPEAGYKPGYSYEFPESDSAWRNQTSRKYFVRATDDRIYGRLEISFIPKYRDSGAIDIKFFVNPTGSRNLEFEPNEVLPR